MARQTTAVVAIASAAGVRGASVGDSEAWLVTDDASRELACEQRRKPLIGSGAALAVPFDDRADAGTLLLGSDGLFKYAPRDRILQVSRHSTLDDAPAHLVDLARLSGGGLQDDVSAIVARWR